MPDGAKCCGQNAGQRARSQSRGGNGERVAILNRVVIEGLSLKAICEQKPDEDEGIGHAHVEEELE